jgi:hypothetical protein
LAMPARLAQAELQLDLGGLMKLPDP